MLEASLKNKKESPEEEVILDLQEEKNKTPEIPKDKESREEVEIPKETPQLEKEIIGQEQDLPGYSAPQIQTPKVSDLPPKSETLIKIEKILSEDLEDIYASLDKPTQEKFKQAGEETAYKIEKILGSVKIKIKEIIKLILEWLKILPGVNKFFIKKQAKIKTEKILNLASKDKQK
ncbi:MAG: hypothetical protein PHS07_01835 [Patescibacteria group bacterium]|jgi:hypothetical protein|nr:hypothetical protein [Patescibacteria group bacterium]